MRDRSVLNEYLRLMQERFPDARMRLVRPFRGADFVVRIEVPEEREREVLDAAADISYDLLRRHRVGIGAHVVRPRLAATA